MTRKYDPIGNITIVKDASQRTLYFSNSVILPELNYTYDALYRLAIATGREKIGTATFGTTDNYNDAPWMGAMWKADDNGCQSYIQKYSYDPVGNILSLQHIGSIAGSYTRGYSYATGTNRLLSTSVGSSTYSYTHDNRGNISQMPHLSSITFNAHNEMSVCNLGGGGYVYYQYSGGQRGRKTVVNGPNMQQRIYLGSYELYRTYTGPTLNLERRTVHVSDDAGRIGMLETRTVGADPSAAVLARYIYSNHLGTATLELDNSANIISYEEYHPYGTTSFQETNAAINAVSKRYRYTGKERDDESGFYYMGARYYAPWLGKWCAVDPKAHETPFESPYNAMGNNPILNIDPDGQSWQPISKDGKTVKLSDKENINGYRWVGYDKDDKGNMVARANTVETAYTFGAKGMTTLSSEGYKANTKWQAYEDISTGDKNTDKKLGTLHPDVQNQMKSFILKAKNRFDIDLRVTDGFRSIAAQDKLYAKGRTAPGSIVTKARGGFSNHNFGLAVDVVPFENGKLNWDTKNYPLIGRIGISSGLEWGGDWKFVDKPHFQNLFGNTLKELRGLPKDANGLPILK